jgi:glutathione S-transferase
VSHVFHRSLRHEYPFAVRGEGVYLYDRDGRRYLAGDQFTAADLTFAALSAPVTLPPEYAGFIIAFEELPAVARSLVARYRDTPAGAFALRIYADHRVTIAGVRAA